MNHHPTRALVRHFGNFCHFVTYPPPHTHGRDVVANKIANIPKHIHKTDVPIGISQQEIAEQNGYTTDRTIRNFKKNIQEKIANVAKISDMELVPERELGITFLSLFATFSRGNMYKL
jgi:hypothetical protein